MDKKVVVVLVTYNRRDCLSVVLSGIENQTYPVSGILIVDNKSTDDTQEFLLQRGFINCKKEGVLLQTLSNRNTKQMYYRNNENVGGAGGFAKAIEIVQMLDFDYVWIMDDDVEPEQNCLELMLINMSDTVKACIPNRSDQYFQDHACIDIDMSSSLKFKITKRKKFVEIPFKKEWYSVKDMAFEGPLIAIDVIGKVGLPNAGFFIEYDDTDYAIRIRKYTEIHFITNAHLHRQLAKLAAAKPSKKSWKYTWRNYYSIRNNILFDHKYGKTWRAKHMSTALLWAWHVLRSLYHGEMGNMHVINKAVNDGMHDRYGRTVKPGEF